jgi:hypothetical protein
MHSNSRIAGSWQDFPFLPQCPSPFYLELLRAKSHWLRVAQNRMHGCVIAQLRTKRRELRVVLMRNCPRVSEYIYIGVE